MARASAALGRIEGEGYGYDAGADFDYGVGPVEASAGAHGSIGARFGADDAVGRRSLILWGASAVWLLLVWRAVEGY